MFNKKIKKIKLAIKPVWGQIKMECGLEEKINERKAEAKSKKLFEKVKVIALERGEKNDCSWQQQENYPSVDTISHTAQYHGLVFIYNTTHSKELGIRGDRDIVQYYCPERKSERAIVYKGSKENKETKDENILYLEVIFNIRGYKCDQDDVLRYLPGEWETKLDALYTEVIQAPKKKEEQIEEK